MFRRRGDGSMRAGVLGDQIGVGAEALAGALDPRDDGVMKQAIEHRGGDDCSPGTFPHSAKSRFEFSIIPRSS